MTTWYLCPSAALKLVVAETGSRELIEVIEAERPRLVASYLLETEVRRAVQRAVGLTQRHATDLLDRLELQIPGPASFVSAGLLPGLRLRSLDAIHLASAISLNVDALVTYDVRMADAARELGVPVISPGVER